MSTFAIDSYSQSPNTKRMERFGHKLIIKLLESSGNDEIKLESLHVGSIGFAKLLLLLFAAFAFFLSGCGNSQAPPPKPPDVEVMAVVQRDVPVYSEWVATLDGYVNAQIKPQVTGYLIKQNYREGYFVRKGEVLWEIDPRPFQAILDQAKAQVAQARFNELLALVQLYRALGGGWEQ
jgi:multidrug efflux pump subunit AcrA (membrane-fusion protein)